MGNLLQSIARFWLLMTGTEKYVSMLETNPALAAALIACVILSVFWMFRWLPTAVVEAGKTVGGLFVGLIYLQVGILVAMMIFGSLAHAGVDITLSGVRQICLIGPILALVGGWVAGKLLDAVILIGIGIYVLGNLLSLGMKALGIVSSTAQKWKADPGEPSFRGVKWLYVISPCVAAGALICNPTWGEPLYYAPAWISGLLGIASIFASRRREEQSRPQPRPEPTPAPVQPPKGWQCKAKVEVRTPQNKLVPMRDIEGNPILVNGRMQPQWTTCDTWNAEDARFCAKCGTPKGGPQPQPAPRPRPEPPPPPVPNLEVPCPHCQTPYDASRGYRNCPHCGQLFARQPA
ncbi:zinc ribbon domain-containing protein, partial [Candidatus Peregrinibacteria bacterium]|nr:zinc ribbon domain-containing protein [Candidatus Peregrinibacteria bacterium]